jgi:hypothetical protein
MAAAEDLADGLDELICSFDKVASAAGEALDTRSLLLLVIVWILVGGAVLFFASAAYGRAAAAAGNRPVAGAVDEGNSVKDHHGKDRGASAEGRPLTGGVRRRRGNEDNKEGNEAERREDGGSRQLAAATSTKTMAATAVPTIAVHPPPASVGSDSEATAWVNECLARLWSLPVAATEPFVRRWLDALTEHVRTSAEG